MSLRPCLLLAVPLLASAPATQAQQMPDSAYLPTLSGPHFARGRGPVACVDAAHNNFHVLGAGFLAFGRLLELDGWRLRSLTADDLDRPEPLKECRVFVSANARPLAGAADAFSSRDVAMVRDWVANGGSLLLIADHMPFGAAARSLAAAFDVSLTDGFAVAPFSGFDDLDRALGVPTLFRRSEGTLSGHVAAGGADSVRSFMGQAFRLPPGAIPILTLPPGYQNLYPDQPWQFSPSTRQEDVAGWAQGALLTFGRGRVAIFGEAAMFTAQLAGPDRLPAGMNAPGADQNHLLVIGLLRWLAGFTQ